MQTLTFTQKLLRQRRFLSFFIPLFALFVGLGSSLTALAGVTGPSNPTLFVDQNSAPGTNTTYLAADFDGANLGTYDINTGSLLLNGGSVTTQETPDGNYDYAVTGAYVEFSVYKTTGGSLGAFTRLALTSSVPDASGNRTFTLTTAQQNLIRQAAVNAGGNSPGTMYSVYTQFGGTYTRTRRSTGVVNNAALPLDNNGGFGYVATFSVTGSPIAATSIGPPTNPQGKVLINTTGATTPNTTYTASAFQGTPLGNYDINTGKLTLNGGQATTFESGGDVVQSARLVYLIVKPPQSGNPGIAFAQSNIPLIASGTPTTGGGGTTRTFANSTGLRNLISGLANSGNGTYTISVTYEAVVLRANGSTFTVRDDNGGPGYTASFTTSGIPILIDTWTGGLSDDWFTPGNWDLNRIPDINTNAVIPDFGVGNTKPYPNIHGDVTYVYNGVTIDNTNSGPAICRDIDMQGSSQAQRSLCRLYDGRWKVYGSFTNGFVSYRQYDGSTIEFAGSGNQTISGGVFTTVEMSGGGTKNLQGIMTVSTSLTFVGPNAGLLTTDISNPDNNYVELSNRSVNAPNGAQLNGETPTGYLRGFVQTTRTGVASNETDPITGLPDSRTYGNMGMTLLFTGINNPGDVLVTRNTAESYTPLVPTTGGTARFGIRRIFGVRPSTTQPLVANLTFRYLDTELTNLGPAGTGAVPEPNLALFVSTSGGNQFGGLRVDALDQTNNILTKNGVSTFATFTLGDKDKPLPVSLTGFDAKRVGVNAMITWQTATELNSKGFEVQVSTNGKDFRTIGAVASEAPNSVGPKNYSYVDVEENKAGQRYYRLRQIDLDGKDTFFAPRVVSFDGKAIETAMTAYPNPFGNADQLHLTLQTAVAGEGLVSITDMTGRLVSQQKVALTTGSNEVTVDRIGELKNGMYMVRFILPSGETKNLKVQKQ